MEKRFLKMFTVRFIIPSTSEMSTTSLHQWQEEIISPAIQKEDIYRWLKNDLAQVPTGKPVIVFNHDLLTSGNEFVFGIDDNEKINLNEHNLKAWLYGHWHNHFVRKQGDVLTISTATLDKGESTTRLPPSVW